MRAELHRRGSHWSRSPFRRFRIGALLVQCIGPIAIFMERKAS